MHFAHIAWLHGLWVLIPLAFLFAGVFRYRRRRMERFAEAGLVKTLTVGYNAKRLRRRFILIAGVLAMSAVALARPQWGFEWRDVHRRALDILVAIDTSRSMLTQDVKPDRLARSKLAVNDLVHRLRGDRIGLIAFAGNAFLVCPLTVDYNGFLLSLEDVDTHTIPRGGTNIGSAITEALSAYKQVPSKYKVLIILTDGENLQGHPLRAARQAKAEGVKVYTIGIGTREGDLIRIPDGSGGYGFLKDANGHFVKSRLNENLLQEIALTTGGIYVRARGAKFGLKLIYDNELSKLQRRNIKTRREKKYFERFQIPLALALCFLLAETLMGMGQRPS